jgi:hypothetical protein
MLLTLHDYDIGDKKVLYMMTLNNGRIKTPPAKSPFFWGHQYGQRINKRSWSIKVLGNF